MNLRGSAVPYVLFIGLLFGSSLVVSRFSVGQFDPRVYTSLRLLIAASLHLTAYLFIGSRVWPRSLYLWKHAAVLGVIGTAIPMTSVILGLQYQSSGVTSLLLTLNPAVTVILAELFPQDENLTRMKVVGVGVAFAGAGLLLVRGETGLASFAQADWRGYAWTGLGIFSSAVGSVYAKRFLGKEDGFDVASVRMFSAALTVNLVTIATVGYDLSRVVNSGYVALAYATFSTFFGFIVSFRIIQRFGATVSSQTSYIIPIVAATCGSLFLSERVTWLMIGGMVVIFLGLALLNWKGGADRLRGFYGIRRYPG
ncbi:MAG: DMT family transporter [Caldilineaceae bacterium]